MNDRPRLLLVGGGHANVAAVRWSARWRQRGTRVMLLSDHPFLYYSGMVPEMTGGVYRPDEARIDLPALCRRYGVEWRQGRVVRLDIASRAVETEEGTRLAADLIALDIGTRTRGEARASGAVPTKPLHRVEALLRMAEDVEAGHERRLVVVGGGAAGVEIALNMTARCGPRLRVAIIEPAPRLLPEFPAGVGRRAANALTGRGATLHLGVPATGADDRGVHLATGVTLPADEVLWATGPAAPPLFREAGLPTDASGYLRVEPTLQVPGHTWLFAAGDCVSLSGHENLAKVGVHAVKQGLTLRENIGRTLNSRLEGRIPLASDLAVFRPYPVAPLILSTGEREGWMVAGRAWLAGTSVLRIKHGVDLRWMRRYTDLPRFDSLAQMTHATCAADRPVLPPPESSS